MRKFPHACSFRYHSIIPTLPPYNGLEDSKPKALVLELVEGPTLAERIAQGPIPLEEVLPIARQPMR